MAKRKVKSKRAAENIAWIEAYCVIPEGRDVGKPVRLREWQRDILRKIYDNPAGTRRAIISMGRKNAKTALSAFIMLLHLVGPEAVPNGQLYSVAQSREQASVLFNLAAKCCRLSSILNEYVGCRETVKELFVADLGTLYKALSAEAGTAYGKSPVLIIHDELGQVRGPRSELYEAMESATAAQISPLSIVISTQAPTDADLLSVLIDDALAGHDPRTVVQLYTASLTMDAFSEEAIRAANPAYGDFQSASEVNDMADAARRMPAREPSYRNLVLNQRVEARSPLIPRSVWQDCEGPVVPDWRGRKVYGGLDLASTTDLAALELITSVDGVWHTRSRFWLPSVGLTQKAQYDRVPYDTWHKQRFLDVTPGKTIEYEFIAAHLREVFDELNVEAIGFDRWNFKHLKPWLQKAGFKEAELAKFIEFGQGFKDMTPAIRSLESDLLAGKIRHDGHPILTMCAANAIVQTDPAGNRKLDKSKSTGRIDGIVALTMARGVAGTTEAIEPKKFQMMVFG